MIIICLFLYILQYCNSVPEFHNGLIASSLTFTNADGQPTKFILGDKENSTQFVHYIDAGLRIETNSKPIVGFTPQNVTFYTPLDIDGVLNIEGKVFVRNVPQWVLVHREDFSSGISKGYDNPSPQLISECAGIPLLGGYGVFSKGEISKEISGLPSHDKLKIQAVFHFIDNWSGEAGFMRLNIGKDGSLVYVWTDSHNQNDDSQSVNVCGSGTGEGKFAVPIEITFPHNSSNLIFAFGSTIETDDPYTQSWGISQFEVYAI